MRKIFDPDAFSVALKNSGLKKCELAQMLGCDPSEITRYENGAHVPRQDRLVKMVEILGPSVTGLSITSNPQSALKNFNRQERKFLSWFCSLPYARMVRIVGFCEAVAAFGTDIDAEFAANLSEKLAQLTRQQREQQG